MRSVFILVICLFVSACSVVDIKTQFPNREAPLEENYFQVEIPTHDGLMITATVYQPKLAAGESAPIIVSTHGFGAFRMPRPMSVYGQMILTGEASLAAWRSGYWVISYDQRGFGGSDGEVRLMDPDYEVKDVSTVIDWVQRSLPRIAKDKKGDIAIGMIGESYGGGAQLMASIQDARIDAIVPIATWYDLAESLAPNDHVKTYWGAILVGFGGVNSGFDFGKIFDDEYFDLVNGQMNPAAKEDLVAHSPRYYCERGQYPQADMLLLQGFRDTVFSINQAEKNRQCGLKGGNDARLIAIQDGHILPWPTQAWSGMPFFNTQPTIVCGEKRFDTVEMVVQWWDEKLRGITPQDAIPGVCLTFSDDAGVVVQDVPVGGEVLAFDETTVSLIQTGWFEMLMEPVDKVVEFFNFSTYTAPIEQQELEGGTFRPGFLPLKVVEDAGYVVGVPKATLHLTTTVEEKDGVLFAAIGVKRAGDSYIHVLSEQYTPLPGDGTYDIDMPAVSSLLEVGDTIGLVLQGYSAQYWFNPEGWFSTATLSGEVSLPIQVATERGEMMVAN
ncbi:hypothetical protein A9Q99_06410 [Gammaproteobacteria bacterium 45_16_T64]|nr:hypothetical protein A9Q99_06410 [Gammaproteobacteria bacterium 45_16_T64]